MQQDKLIKKALEEAANFSLPPDFNERAMLHIYKETERKKKQNFFLMLGCISAVSLSLIGVSVYLLKKYFAFDFTFRLQLPTLKFVSLSQYYFDIYIAVLILVLIGFDYLFRSYWRRRSIG
ncbi:hypothetical protein A9P82_00290 [Arachidicoccus ginsenosidimutans]|uniref:hypothetical protein n=1 Tax=Arachidicoccus sp. BS20 TaxID=1850526 RepID=UPI0007F0C783|nr:hypothetical protein [Arachidicoccus sp. BS20]ANI87895.1 hypothetical protein A9P82_00290 [Arachidicoccus sp. BS20]